MPFLPEILTNELLWAGLTLAVLIIGVTWFYHAPLEHHASPLVTPLHTTAPWYSLWIQGMLKLGDPTLMGVIAVSSGIKGSTMPAWAKANGGPLADQQIDDVAACVISMQKAGGAPTFIEPTPAPTSSFTGDLPVAMTLVAVIVAALLVIVLSAGSAAKKA